jgi:parvulin-like peptidyl-prolyl isomerase
MKIVRTALASLLSLLLAIGFIGCAQKEVEKQIAATVNGVEILEDDVTIRIESYRVDASTGEAMDDVTWATTLANATFTPETFRDFVIRNQFAIDILILQKAAEVGITPSAEEVDQRIADVKASVETSGSTWEEYLQSSGYASETAYRQYIESRMIGMDFVNSQIGDTTPTQAEIETYVSENAASYAGKRFSLIYLPYDPPAEADADTGDSTASDGAESPTDAATTETPADTSATSAAAVLLTAEEALEKINGGTDFATVAQEYSQNQSTAQKGGDFGWGAEASLPTEAKEALDALRVGEVSGIVDSSISNAYFIIECTEEFILPQATDETTSEEATDDSDEASEENAEAEQGSEQEAEQSADATDTADTTEPATDASGPTTVEFSAVPASLVELLSTNLTESQKTAAQEGFLTGLTQSDEIVINPMPEGLSYAVDMSLVEAEAEENEVQGPESAPEPTFDESGLGISDIVVGTGPEAKEGDTVLVHYSGYLASGEQFDSSIDIGQPYEVIIGQSSVIEGWHLGLVGMKVGGKRQIVIPPELAYGATGSNDGTIPPNATLTFDIELLSVNGDTTGSSGESITPVTPSEETEEG